MRKILLIIPAAFAGSIFLKRSVYAMTPVTVYEVKAVIDEIKRDHDFLKHVPNPLIMGICEVESGFDNRVIGSVGEIGLMQVKPSTSKWIRSVYNVKPYSSWNQWNINNQILDGMLYLHWILDKQIGHLGTIHSYNVGYNGYVNQNKRNWRYVAKVTEAELRWLI